MILYLDFEIGFWKLYFVPSSGRGTVSGIGFWTLDFGGVLSNWDFRLELFQSPNKDNGIVIIPKGRYKLGVYRSPHFY